MNVADRGRALEALDRLGAPVVALGSLNADLTVTTQRLPGPGETVVGSDLRILPGGKSANQAATAALLGVPTTMIGAVGRDGNGQLLLESLALKGVDTRHVYEREVATGTAMITVDAAAENTIVISPGANATLTPADVVEKAQVIAEAGALGLCLEVSLETVTAAARCAHEAGVPVVLNVSPARQLSPELLELTDVLIVNQHELSLVSGQSVDTADLEQVAKAFMATGVKRGVLTLGGAGSLIYEDGRLEWVAAFKVTPVDTTGAGDSFMGTLLSALAAGVSLADGATLAAAVAACSTTKVGAQASYASADEVREFLK